MSDKSGGQYIAYAQVLDMGQLGKTEGEKSGESPGAWIAIARGATMDEAAHDFYQITPRKTNWGHVNALILTENTLKAADWTKILDTFTRYNEFRYTTWVFCTRDSPQSIVSTDPVIENSPVYSGLGDPVDLYRESSFIRPMRMNRFIANLHEPSKPHLLPELSIEPNRWFESDQPRSTLTLSGYAMFDNQRRFEGRMSRAECAGLRWTDRHLIRTSLNLTVNEKPIASSILTSHRVRVRYVKTKQGIQYQLNVSMKGIVPEKYGEQSLQNLDTIAAREIRKEIYQTYLNGLKSNMDILGLQDSLYRKNPALYHHVAKLQKHSLRPDSLTINVRVNLLTSGRTLEGPSRFTRNESR